MSNAFFKLYAAFRWAYDVDLSQPVEIVTAAKKPIVAPPKVERAVLLALIVHLDQETLCGYPRQKTLAGLTGWSERYIFAGLQSLEARGLITREERWRNDGTHRRKSDLITLHLPADVASRYRKDAWAAPDEEMLDVADWFDEIQATTKDTCSQGLRRIPSSISIDRERKRSAAESAGRSRAETSEGPA